MFGGLLYMKYNLKGNIGFLQKMLFPIFSRDILLRVFVQLHVYFRSNRKVANRVKRICPNCGMIYFEDYADICSYCDKRVKIAVIAKKGEQTTSRW